MPAKHLVVAPKADKQFLRLPREIQRRIIKSYDKIKENPIVGAKLGGELESFYKLKVGDYRIIYSFDKKASTAIVVKVEHRQGVYK